MATNLVCKESKLLTPIGKEVTVNGHRMNVSVKGEATSNNRFFPVQVSPPIYLDFKNFNRFPIPKISKVVGRDYDMAV